MTVSPKKSRDEAMTQAQSAVFRACGSAAWKGMFTPLATVASIFMSEKDKELIQELLFDQDTKADSLITEIGAIFEVDVNDHLAASMAIEAVRAIAVAKQIKGAMSPIWLAANPAFATLSSVGSSAAYLLAVGEAAISYFEKRTNLK